MSNSFDPFQVGDLVTVKDTKRFVWRIKKINKYSIKNQRVYFMEGALDSSKIKYDFEENLSLFAINEHADECLKELDENGEIPICDIIETGDKPEMTVAPLNHPVWGTFTMTLKTLVNEYGKTVHEEMNNMVIKHYRENDDINKLLDEYAMILSVAEHLGGHTEYTETAMYETEEKMLDIIRKMQA